MTKGFLFGAGLIVVGLVLQLIVGPIVWSIFAWPVNIIVLAILLFIIAATTLLGKRSKACRFLSTSAAAVPALCYATALTIVMGFTRQSHSGTWLSNMLSFWPFVLIYTYIVLILGLVILRQILHSSFHHFSLLIFHFSFFHSSLLFHLGLFIVLTTATLGNADIKKVHVFTTNNPEMANMLADAEVFHQYERFAIDNTGHRVELPIAIELKRFIMETYEDGITPRRFASEVFIHSKESHGKYAATIDVNKPAEVDGWKIYQKDYRLTPLGDACQISILELVRDPWLPWVYVGIFMMLAGALLLVLKTRWRVKRLLPIGLLLVAALAFVSYLIPIIRSDTLVPALQSPWFYPHILAYIVSYSLMGVATIMAIYCLIKRPFPSSLLLLISSLVYVGFAFLTFGMLFGALWAKEAWGHYWEWDPKETWAAITWFSYLVYIHYCLLPKANSKEPKANRLALCMLIISFALLQMCWWGINYLPSAQGTSVHTYNAD